MLRNGPVNASQNRAVVSAPLINRAFAVKIKSLIELEWLVTVGGANAEAR